MSIIINCKCRLQEVIIPKMIQTCPLAMWIKSNPGGGKTIAYAIAVLQKIDCTQKYTQALCLTESNESAVQVYNCFVRLAAYKNVSIGLAIKTNRGNTFSVFNDTQKVQQFNKLIFFC